MPTVILDLATLQFVPANYTRIPQGSEDERAVAAHLRGISNAFGVQAGVNSAFATDADQRNQYAVLTRTDIKANLVQAAERVPLVFSDSLQPPFDFSRAFGPTGWGSSANSLLFPDTGLWGFLAQVEVSSSGSGVVWTFEFELPVGTTRAIPYRERVSITSEPRTLSLVGTGRVQTLLTDDDRRLRCFISHDSGVSQTLTVGGIYWQARRLDS